MPSQPTSQPVGSLSVPSTLGDDGEPAAVKGIGGDDDRGPGGEPVVRRRTIDQRYQPQRLTRADAAEQLRSRGAFFCISCPIPQRLHCPCDSNIITVRQNTVVVYSTPKCSCANPADPCGAAVRLYHSA
jgi:hypothetical protein